MIIFYTDPPTHINDNLELKNGNTSPLNRIIKGKYFPELPKPEGYTWPQYAITNGRDWYQADFYKNFGLDIVTETVFDYPYPFITEKTLRPITSKRPFIVVGAVGTLNLLRKKGFRTFNQILDESYDDIINPSDRFDSVTASIKNFVTQPLDKIKNDVISISDVLEHNFQHYLMLEDIEISQLNL